MKWVQTHIYHNIYIIAWQVDEMGTFVVTDTFIITYNIIAWQVDEMSTDTHLSYHIKLLLERLMKWVQTHLS